MKVKRLLPLETAITLAAGRQLSASMLYIRRQTVYGRPGYIELPVLPRVHRQIMEAFIDPAYFRDLFPDAAWQPKENDLVLPNCDLSAEGRDLLAKGTEAARQAYPGVWDDCPLTLFTLLKQARRHPELWHLLELKAHE